MTFTNDIEQNFLQERHFADHNKLWKILKEMGIPDHLICLLRNLYGGQEATVRTGHGNTRTLVLGGKWASEVSRVVVVFYILIGV